MRQRGQANIGIILAQQNTVFRSRSKHPVRLIHALIDQVINQDANIGLVPTQHERILPSKLSVRIDTRHQTLGGRFLISRCTIDLASQEKTLDNSRLQGILQILRIEVIVFNCVSWLNEYGILKAGNGVNGLELHFLWQ